MSRHVHAWTVDTQPGAFTGRATNNAGRRGVGDVLAIQWHPACRRSLMNTFLFALQWFCWEAKIFR